MSSSARRSSTASFPARAPVTGRDNPPRKPPASSLGDRSVPPPDTPFPTPGAFALLLEAQARWDEDDHPERPPVSPLPTPDLRERWDWRGNLAFEGQNVSRNPPFELVVAPGSDTVLLAAPERSGGEARGTTRTKHADVAQLVEHHLAKVRVAGSKPVVRSVARLRADSDPREAALSRP